MPGTRAPNIPPDPLVGATLDGRFEIEKLIDRGGMGKIYRAVQQPLGRPIALKTLDLLDPTGEYQQRFFNEAAIASKLSHPHTVRIFDYGRAENGVYYLTMELLKGTSMHRVMKKEGALDALRVIRIGRQVCGALHEAHMAGIVHRDMKPGNIFLTKHDDEDFAKVLDFGLVKDLGATEQLSHTGQTLGSPLYMSPEQVEGTDLDHRSDIYSLGLVLYVAVCGKVPFKRGNVATVMFQQVSARIPTFSEITPDLTIPSGLEWVIRRCIEKDPEERFATMRDLSLALKLAAQEHRGEIAPLTWELEDGRLVLPDDLGEPQITEVETVPPPINTNHDEASLASSRPIEPVPPMSEDSESSLERSNVSLLVGGAAATAGGLGLGILVMLGVIVLIGGGMGLWYVNQAQVDPPVVEPTPPPEPVDKAEPVMVTLTSEPAGAEVLRDGSLLGTTPLELRLGTTDELEPMNLTLQADGYSAREVTVDGTVAAVTIPLKKLRVRTPTPTPEPEPEPQPTEPKPDKVDDGVRDPWAAVMLWALLLGLNAFADEPMTEAERDEQARVLFQEGRDTFNDGRFEEAVLNWEKAYALSERPLILFNLAEAYERVGEFEAALNALETYLPDAQESEEGQIAARIDSLKTRASIQAKEREANEAEQKAREAQLEAERLRSEELARKAQELEQQVKQKPRSLVGPILLIGGGMAALGVATVGGVVVTSTRNDLKDPALCSESGLCKREAEELVANQKAVAATTDVVQVGGIVAIGIGAVWLARQVGANSRDKNKKTTAWAVPTQSGVLLGVDGAF